jgi:hypothetical protein
MFLLWLKYVQVTCEEGDIRRNNHLQGSELNIINKFCILLSQNSDEEDIKYFCFYLSITCHKTKKISGYSFE